MKSVAKIIILIISISSLNLAYAQSKSELPLTHKISSPSLKEIHIYTNTELECIFTEGEYITTELNVKSNVQRKNVTKHLQSQKRYTISFERKKGELNFYMPNLYKIVKINGTVLEDIVQIKMYIPKGIKVIQHHNFNDIVDIDNEKNAMAFN